MLVGFRKTTLVDFPGKIAAALFLPGCNLRCPWCHNRELVLGGTNAEEADLVPLPEALETIRKRSSVLGGVVVSGGEPLARPEIGGLLAEVKRLGLPVKLDTNGTYPERLETLLSVPETAPDFIALDLKVAPERYVFLGQRQYADAHPAAVERTARLLAESGAAHEFRSLALPDGFFTEADVEALAPLVDEAPWFFSLFRPGNCLDDAWNGLPQSTESDAKELARKAVALGKDGRTR